MPISPEKISLRRTAPARLSPSVKANELCRRRLAIRAVSWARSVIKSCATSERRMALARSNAGQNWAASLFIMVAVVQLEKVVSVDATAPCPSRTGTGGSPGSKLGPSATQNCRAPLCGESHRTELPCGPIRTPAVTCCRAPLGSANMSGGSPLGRHPASRISHWSSASTMFAETAPPASKGLHDNVQTAISEVRLVLIASRLMPARGQGATPKPS